MHAPPETFHPLRSGDPDRIGGYRLYARLGAGGMGEVFLSFTPGGRAVAVKMIRREFADDPRFRARFMHEARAAQRVSGTHIAQLLDAGPDAATPWLATAYVAGPTLAETVQLYGPLPVASVIVLMSSIAESLRVIHEAGLVHRDLKPANVVLGNDGVQVIDFGIARATEGTALTLSGMMVGSPQYAAPEQVLGHPTTAAGDIFALGALAYYAATGRAAFGDGPEFSVVYRVVNAEPDLAGCPLQLRALIQDCLSKEPEDRPTTADVLESCRPDEPPQIPEDWLPTEVCYAIQAYRTSLATFAAQARADQEAAEQRDRPAPRPVIPVEPDEPEDATGPGAARAPRDDEQASATHVAEAAGGTGDKRGGGARRVPRRAAVGAVAALALIATGVGLTLGLTSYGPSQNASAHSVTSHTAAQTSTPHKTPSAASASPSAASSEVPLSIGSLSPPPDGLGQTGQPPPPGGGGGGGGGNPPPGAPREVPATEQVWYDTVTITDAGLWLDQQPPLVADTDVHGDVREYDPAPDGVLTSNGPHAANMVVWTGSGTPDGSDCQTALAASHSWLVRAQTGSIVCLRTAKGQTAVITIDAFPTDYSGITAYVTVWGDGQPLPTNGPP
ncbi:MAG TPA: serine/threonine-protein kinase [Actinocrinis sp.]